MPISTPCPASGPDLAGKIAEIVHTGSCPLLERLRKELPPAISELLKLPGIGPKRARRLYERPGVRTVEELHRCRAAKARARGGRLRRAHRAAHSRGDDLPTCTSRVDSSSSTHSRWPMTCSRVQTLAAGSLRRGRDTTGDLDLLVTIAPDSRVIERFTAHAEVREVLSHGTTRASVVLKNGMQVDLRAVPPESFGAAAVYFTGSKAHNIALRRLTQEADLKINKYGVFRGMQRIAGKTEESVFRTVGLPVIPAELREDRGELEAARQGRLPQLVQLADLRGDLHAHTKESDGHDTLGRRRKNADCATSRSPSIRSASRWRAVSIPCGWQSRSIASTA